MTTTRTEGKTDEPKTREPHSRPRTEVKHTPLAMKVKAETLRNSQQQEDCYVTLQN